jgi:hypothetical protein
LPQPRFISYPTTPSMSQGTHLSLTEVGLLYFHAFGKSTAA